MTQESTWHICAFRKSLNRRSFACGEERLDNWLRDQSVRFHDQGFGQVYCAVDSATQAVIGYYSLSCHAVKIELLPPEAIRRSPRLTDIPSVLLGKLAVQVGLQGKGIGTRLLVDAMSRTLALSEIAGARLLEVDALTEDACKFYLKFGFEPLRDDHRHLFLQIDTIRQSVEKARASAK